MVEVDSPPGNAVVAAGTVASQAAFVGFLLVMAGVAVGWRLAEELAFHVAAVARECGMRAPQREVRLFVIELIPAELHDVGVASEVF